MSYRSRESIAAAVRRGIPAVYLKQDDVISRFLVMYPYKQHGLSLSRKDPLDKEVWFEGYMSRVCTQASGPDVVIEGDRLNDEELKVMQKMDRILAEPKISLEDEGLLNQHILLNNLPLTVNELRCIEKWERRLMLMTGYRYPVFTAEDYKTHGDNLVEAMVDLRLLEIGAHKKEQLDYIHPYSATSQDVMIFSGNSALIKKTYHGMVTTLLDQPIVVIEMVVSYLKLHEVGALRQTTTSAGAIVFEPREIPFTGIELNDYRLHIGPNLKFVRSVVYRPAGEVKTESIQTHTDKTDELVRLLSLTPNVETLHLSILSVYRLYPVANAINSLKLLRSLTLGDTGPLKHLISTRIDHLGVTEPDFITRRDLEYIARYTSLKKLEVGRCDNIASLGLDNVFRRCTLLEVLETILTGSDSLTSLHCAKNLRKITISVTRCVTIGEDVGLSSSLKEVVIKSVRRGVIRDYTLLRINESKSIQSLTLEGNVSDTAFESLYGMESLRSLTTDLPAMHNLDFSNILGLQQLVINGSGDDGIGAAFLSIPQSLTSLTISSGYFELLAVALDLTLREYRKELSITYPNLSLVIKK